ncbi:hypothetical protein PSHT_01140, partial [Puccinia striiformis]
KTKICPHHHTIASITFRRCSPNPMDLCHLDRQTPKLDSVVHPDESGSVVDLCKDSETEDPKTAPDKKKHDKA